MQLRKYRWSSQYESAEEELVSLLNTKKITAERWTAEGGHEFAPHQHPHDKRLWCAEGSIVVTVLPPHSKSISMQPGDTLDLPAGTPHSAVAGISGVVCYESPPPSQNPSLPAPHN